MKVLTAACSALALIGVMVAGGASAETSSNVLCPSVDDRDRLTADGFSHAFSAPAPAAPELAATRDVTGRTVTTWREAKFPFVVDAAPSSSLTVDIDLGWKRTSDYDLYVLGADGTELAVSAESNAETGVPAESVAGLRLKHCDQITVVVRNWAGIAQDLFLEVVATPGAALLACADGDPAPGCAGKPAGDAPEPVADTRTPLFLGGDPGQASMVWGYTGTTELPQATLTAERPTAGVPNQYTRPVAGFRDQYRNPFVPHFSADFAEPRQVVGDASALVWVSSPTLREGGLLFADLYVDGALVSTVEVPGEQVGTDPTPLTLSFPGVNVRRASSVTLQLATTPAVSSAGVNEPADALFTVHYGGVQFPSRVNLP